MRNYSAKMKFLRISPDNYIKRDNVEVLRLEGESNCTLKNEYQAGKIKEVEMEVSDKTFNL